MLVILDKYNLSAALSGEPEVMMDVLAALAGEDFDGEHFSTELQQAYCPQRHRGLAAFLRRLVDKVEAIEAENAADLEDAQGSRLKLK